MVTNRSYTVIILTQNDIEHYRFTQWVSLSVGYHWSLADCPPWVFYFNFAYKIASWAFKWKEYKTVIERLRTFKGQKALKNALGIQSGQFSKVLKNKDGTVTKTKP